MIFSKIIYLILMMIKIKKFMKIRAIIQKNKPKILNMKLIEKIKNIKTLFKLKTCNKIKNMIK